MGNQFIMPKQVFYGENALKDAADVIALPIFRIKHLLLPTL